MKREQWTLDRLVNASPEERRRIVYQMTEERARTFDGDYENWAHEAQLPPPGERWRVWLLMAGRGFGKTRAGAEWVYRMASAKAGSRIALVGATISDARNIMVEGVSGLLAVGGLHKTRLIWEPSLGRLTWPNRSEAQLFSGDHGDGLRGPEHDIAWVLTFEVFGDASPPAIADILADASAGAVASTADRAIAGYAAYGGSIQAAVQPLADGFDIALFDDGLNLRTPVGTTPLAVDPDDLGNSADGRAAPRIQSIRRSAREIPASLRLGYYDPERDYQGGEARAAATEDKANEDRRELAAALDASAAKSLAQEILARAWSGQNRLTLTLPPRYMALEPGMQLQLDLMPALWRVERCTIDSFVTVVELQPYVPMAPALSAASGRVADNPDVVASEAVTALFEIPDGSGSPSLLLAASRESPGWKSRVVEVEFGGQRVITRTARRKAKLGHASTVLGPADASVIDLRNSVDVDLVDPSQWLVSSDDEALAAGANAALLGEELIQFGEAIPIGAGRFRLSRLLRGRRGTEQAVDGHLAGERFALLEVDALRRIELPLWR